MTAAETPHLALHATLFVCPLDPRDRELRLIEIVRTQRDKTIGLHTLTAAQHLLDSAREIVVAHQTEHPAEPVKRLHVSLQERLLGAVRERHRERRTGMAGTHVEQVDPRRGSSHPDLRLTPVDLALHARLMGLRHERLHALAALPASTMHVFPDSAFSDISRVLIAQAFPDPLRGVALLARRVAVTLKPGIDQLPICPQLRRRPADRRPLDGRQRRGQRLTHRTAMNTVALRQRPDRQILPISVPPDLLERLHS
jgi:hypothetical protein